MAPCSWFLAPSAPARPAVYTARTHARGFVRSALRSPLWRVHPSSDQSTISRYSPARRAAVLVMVFMGHRSPTLTGTCASPQHSREASRSGYLSGEAVTCRTLGTCIVSNILFLAVALADHVAPHLDLSICQVTYFVMRPSPHFDDSDAFAA